MKILLATDGSSYAEEAAWLLAHLPHTERIELTILSVNSKSYVHGSLEVVEWVQKEVEAAKTQMSAACERVAQMFEGADVRVETLVSEGHPGTSIVNTAKERAVDLIVLGAVGHSTLDRMLLGSVSDFVATHASCSVLVVRPTGLREGAHPSLRLCIAYDGSDPCQAAIEKVRAFRWQHNTKIDLLTVLALSYQYTDNPLAIDTQAIKAAMLQSVEQAAEKLHGLSPEVNPHFIQSSHVGDSVVEFAKKQATDIIVVGDTGHGLLGRFLMGSVSRYILRHAHCCVWIVRDQAK